MNLSPVGRTHFDHQDVFAIRDLLARVLDDQPPPPAASRARGTRRLEQGSIHAGQPRGKPRGLPRMRLGAKPRLEQGLDTGGGGSPAAWPEQGSGQRPCRETSSTHTDGNAPRPAPEQGSGHRPGLEQGSIRQGATPRSAPSGARCEDRASSKARHARGKHGDAPRPAPSSGQRPRLEQSSTPLGHAAPCVSPLCTPAFSTRSAMA